MPPENASLHGLVYKGARYDYDEGEVEKGDKLEYHCFNGRKNVLDFDFTFQEAGCSDENVWTPPTVWENCTTSKTSKSKSFVQETKCFHDWLDYAKILNLDYLFEVLPPFEFKCAK